MTLFLLSNCDVYRFQSYSSHIKLHVSSKETCKNVTSKLIYRPFRCTIPVFFYGKLVFFTVKVFTKELFSNISLQCFLIYTSVLVFYASIQMSALGGSSLNPAECALGLTDPDDFLFSKKNTFVV